MFEPVFDQLLVRHAERVVRSAESGRVRDAKNDVRAVLILLRNTAMCDHERLMDAQNYLRVLQRRVRKMEENGIEFLYGKQMIENARASVDCARQILATTGESVMYFLNLWQVCGASLGELYNLCNVVGPISCDRAERSWKDGMSFSSFVLATALDYKESWCEWISAQGDAPFSHAMWAAVMQKLKDNPDACRVARRKLHEIVTK